MKLAIALLAIGAQAHHTCRKANGCCRRIAVYNHGFEGYYSRPGKLPVSPLILEWEQRGEWDNTWEKGHFKTDEVIRTRWGKYTTKWGLIHGDDGWEFRKRFGSVKCKPNEKSTCPEDQSYMCRPVSYESGDLGDSIEYTDSNFRIECDCPDEPVPPPEHECIMKNGCCERLNVIGHGIANLADPLEMELDKSGGPWPAQHGDIHYKNDETGYKFYHYMTTYKSGMWIFAPRFGEFDTNNGVCLRKKREDCPKDDTGPGSYGSFGCPGNDYNDNFRIECACPATTTQTTTITTTKPSCHMTNGCCKRLKVIGHTIPNVPDPLRIELDDSNGDFRFKSAESNFEIYPHATQNAMLFGTVTLDYCYFPYSQPACVEAQTNIYCYYDTWRINPTFRIECDCQ